MSNLTAGIPPQPYGQGGRRVNLPVQATAQLYEGAMVSQIAGACVTGTSSGAGDCCGVAQFDMLGGASDGLKRIILMTDQIFTFTAGTAAPTDATPYGTTLYMETDHTVGTGGLGADEGVAGKFVGMNDDGTVRVYIGTAPNVDAYATGTALTDIATTTITRKARRTKYLLAGTMSQGETVTLGTTGAVKGDRIEIIRTSTSAQTLTVVNGGAGAGTLCVLVASKVGFAYAEFDGTNWLYDGSSAT